MLNDSVRHRDTRAFDTNEMSDELACGPAAFAGTCGPAVCLDGVCCA